MAVMEDLADAATCAFGDFACALGGTDAYVLSGDACALADVAGGVDGVVSDEILSSFLNCGPRNFSGWGMWRFAGVFAKNRCLIVVFWWCKRGGWVVKRGVLAVSFLASKNAPWFLSLFFWGSRFWNAETAPLVRVCAGEVLSRFLLLR